MNILYFAIENDHSHRWKVIVVEEESLTILFEDNVFYDLGDENFTKIRFKKEREFNTQKTMVDSYERIIKKYKTNQKILGITE
jgi:hypothetical protein